MRRSVALATTLLFGLSSAATALACTRVLWTTQDGQVFLGRTNDWTGKVGSAFRVFPRGIERVGAVNANPYRWTTKFGSLVLTGYDMGTHEGMNEKGLATSLLYLAEINDFGKRDPGRAAIGVMQWAQYYLDNFATVAEAVEAQKSFSFQIEPMILPNGHPTTVHLALSDKTGDSAVIEYIGGKAIVHHSRTYSVMTNEPAYEQQIQNLKQYRTFGGDKPLPGERKSMDRFVRAASYVNGLPQPANKDEGVAYLFSVMRNVSVPFGVGDAKRPNIAPTIFRTVMDLTGNRYFFESTYAPNVVWVDASRIDFSEGSGERELKVEKRIMGLHGDVTGLLEPAKPLVFGVSKA